MAFELAPDKRLRKSLRSTVDKQLRRAEADSRRKHPGGRDGAVHEIRKRLKRVRALVRLVRPAIGDKQYGRENRALRDLARPLSEVRDAKVLVTTFDKLVRSHADSVRSRRFAPLHAMLHDDLQATRKRVLDEGDAFARSAEGIKEARRRVDDWTDVADRWSSLGDGLRRTYDEARRAMEKAADQRDVEALHEWRKQAKYLRYQLELLRPLWEPRVSELAEEADRMGSLLGDDHDLAVLMDRLGGGGMADQTQSAAAENHGDAAAALTAMAESRRTELQEKALRSGRRFFAESDGDFARQLKTYWKAWRKETRSKSEPESTPAGSAS